MPRRWTITLLSAVLLLALALGACSSASESVPTPTSMPATAEQETDDTPVPTQEQSAAQEPEPQIDEPAEVKPTPKSGLVATDPTTVNLASGEPKLVEFFAFW